ncbi:MAG TPA: hypothetical protein VKH42_11745 [Vicinamibacterales bacterium]|nr:hypothetical protein [Vicinamibacterales bacterium]
MRIKIMQQPSIGSIDGIRLDRFLPGFEYDVNATLGAYLLVEGWAELQADIGAAVPTQRSRRRHEEDDDAAA